MYICYVGRDEGAQRELRALDSLISLRPSLARRLVVLARKA